MIMINKNYDFFRFTLNSKNLKLDCDHSDDVCSTVPN